MARKPDRLINYDAPTRKAEEVFNDHIVWKQHTYWIASYGFPYTKHMQFRTKHEAVAFADSRVAGG